MTDVTGQLTGSRIKLQAVCFSLSKSVGKMFHVARQQRMCLSAKQTAAEYISILYVHTHTHTAVHQHNPIKHTHTPTLTALCTHSEHTAIHNNTYIKTHTQRRSHQQNEKETR